MTRIVTVTVSCVMAGDLALGGQVSVRLIAHAHPLGTSTVAARALVILVIAATFLTRAVLAARLRHRLAAALLCASVRAVRATPGAAGTSLERPCTAPTIELPQDLHAQLGQQRRKLAARLANVRNERRRGALRPM
jgi:hypothetical protein